jgi:hypothetical protein
VFPDRGLAIAGRVTVNARIIETGTQPYRLAISWTARRKPARRWHDCPMAASRPILRAIPEAGQPWDDPSDLRPGTAPRRLQLHRRTP